MSPAASGSGSRSGMSGMPSHRFFAINRTDAGPAPSPERSRLARQRGRPARPPTRSAQRQGSSTVPGQVAVEREVAGVDRVLSIHQHGNRLLDVLRGATAGLGEELGEEALADGTAQGGAPPLTGLPKVGRAGEHRADTLVSDVAPTGRGVGDAVALEEAAPDLLAVGSERGEEATTTGSDATLGGGEGEGGGGRLLRCACAVLAQLGDVGDRGEGRVLARGRRHGRVGGPGGGREGGGRVGVPGAWGQPRDESGGWVLRGHGGWGLGLGDVRGEGLAPGSGWQVGGGDGGGGGGCGGARGAEIACDGGCSRRGGGRGCRAGCAAAEAEPGGCGARQVPERRGASAECRPDTRGRGADRRAGSGGGGPEHGEEPPIASHRTSRRRL